jgi:L-amino acid N-acyltransferase YncA
VSGDRYGIRDASPADAQRCADIYAPYVTETAISFEADPPTTAEMADRIGAALRTHAWLVLEHEADVVGYAYGGPFRSRPAYRWSAEVSVYVDLAHQRAGGGRALYEELFTRLARRGYRTVLAGMTLPNDASEALHRALGFEAVGTYRNVGWKHGRWRDVAWVQRTIGTFDAPPTELR